MREKKKENMRESKKERERERKDLGWEMRCSEPTSSRGERRNKERKKFFYIKKRKIQRKNHTTIYMPLSLLSQQLLLHLEPT
jgi:hypothetical protein